MARSSVYYTPNTAESPENLALMRLIDTQYLKTPFYGVPRITLWLHQHGHYVNQKRVARLMRVMGTLLKKGVRISMDGRGRALDNVFIERLWRSVKYEDIYLRDYADGHALYEGLTRYFRFYNHERPHSALNNQTPASCHKRNG